jgi:hypothetical protein
MAHYSYLEDCMSHNEVAAKMKDTLEALRKNKPKDRSEIDRVYQICITDLEKLLGYFEHNVQINKSSSEQKNVRFIGD